MMHLKAWGSTFVLLVTAAGCGETSNFVGTTTDAGSGGASAGNANGGTKAQAGSSSQAGTKSSVGGTTESGGADPGSAGAGGTSASGGKSQGGSSTGGTDPVGCRDLGGNWQSCDNGVHRPEPGKCTSHLPRPASIPPIDPAQDECTKDAECTKKPNGFCAVFSAGFSEVKPHNFCDYGCLQDSDCDASTICLCGPTIGTCTTFGACKSDKDCSGGEICGQYDSCPGVPTTAFLCTTPQDQCSIDADCKEPMKQFCGNVGDHRECRGVVCAASG